MRHEVKHTDEKTGQLSSKMSPYRVTACLYHANPGEKGVTVVSTSQGAAYAGLQVCGSVWHCPVCAARISNQRRLEITEVLSAAALRGYRPILVTFTARHRADTALDSQLEAMTEAYRALWRGEPAKRFKKRFGVLGIIRNLEVTHSKRNGWHPHIHAIVLVPTSVSLSEFAEDLRGRWEQKAAAYGLTMNQHGFDATDANERVADYLAKFDGREPSLETQQRWQNGWNEADELVRWHMKRGKVNHAAAERIERGEDQHCTPWQLLEFFLAGDEKAGKLFRKYALVFHGRQQIHGLGELRKELGLSDEVSDQEAAENELEGKELLRVFLSLNQWAIVRGNDARAELLDIVERGSPDQIKADCLELFGFTPLIVEPGQRDQVEGDES